MFKLSITFGSKFANRLREQKRRPIWVALAWLAMCARDLAPIPRSESGYMAGLPLHVKAIPARRGRRAWVGFGSES